MTIVWERRVTSRGRWQAQSSIQLVPLNMGNRHSRRRRASAQQGEAASDAATAVQAPAASSAAERRIVLLHFNDVYNIEPATRDPVGGAARMCHKVKSMSAEQPLVVFSGDAFSPSLLSVVTLGAQMPPVLNNIGVHIACVGNHDLDFGAAQFKKLAGQCKFPWLMSNVVDAQTGEPYANTRATHIIDWNGVKVGFVGLIEEEWLETLGAVDPQEVHYKDFVTEGHRLASQLKEQGAELLVAITHMRVPNDRKFAAECPEYHIVMGGHDHHYESDFIGPHKVLMVKSGTDFRDMTKVEVVMPKDPEQRPSMTWERITIDSSVPEDPETKEVVDSYLGKMASKMEEIIGYTDTDLDGRFTTVRTAESNLGNFVCDVMRLAMGADVCMVNGGSFRSDTIHPKGPFRLSDLSSILPYLDETSVVEVTGQQLLASLENSVSMYPKLEGRFCQVSGVSFLFDPSQPPDNRVVKDSVCVGGKPMEAARKYKMVTKTYMTEGKDGFDMLVDCPVLVDAEQSMHLPTTVRNHFRYLEVLALWDPRVKAVKAARKWRAAAKQTAEAANGASQEDDDGGDEAVDDTLADVRSRPSRYALEAAENSLCHLGDGHFCINPGVEGRISRCFQMTTA